jgi:uncharacterized protein (DUF2235 family)
MPKNIVVFSDGTGQEGGVGNPTNVYKLFNMIVDRSSEQISFYDRGLGTDWRRFTGSAFGAGISHNIRECYEFIFENYEFDDQIYLFGFSRGAFTVRSLAGFIHNFGMLPRSRHDLIKPAYKIYKIKDKNARKAEAKKFVAKHHTMWCKIKFIGVWDTVGALGIPYRWLDTIVNQVRFLKHEFHDTTFSKAVECGYHALSIDDERLVFHPTLWDEATVGTVLDENRIEKPQIVEQVWFAGVHTDVGGGFVKPPVKDEDQALPALSDISLEWMVKKAEDKGLLIYKKIKTNPDAKAKIHDTPRFYRSSSRGNAKEELDKLKGLKVHQSVIDRHHDADMRYNPWILERDDYTVEPW